MTIISKRKAVLLGCAAALVIPANVASAQPLTAEQAAALIEKLNSLEAEVVELRSKVRSLETAQTESAAIVASTNEKIDATTAQVAKVEKQQAKNTNTINWKGAPEIKGKDGWSFKPRGRIQYDFGSVNAPNTIMDPGLGFGNESRRIRLGASGSIPGGFGYKLEVDFADDDVALTDANFTYKDDGLTITLGQHNPFQGLEELSSSNDTSFIERAGYTDAFGFERQVGISGQYKAKDILLQAGVFTDNINALNDDGNNSIGVDLRAVAMPKINDAQLHFGASFHWKDLGDSITSRRYRQRPLVHFTDTRFINTGSISNATSETRFGAEAAIIAGRFHAAAEGHWLKLGRNMGLAEPTFFGGSVEAGVFLTDDKRGYRDGVFKAVKVSNPVGNGGMGAWQFNVRYDHLDLVDAGIVGGVQDSYQASLIWTPVDYVRFMVNYGRLDYDNAAILAAGSGDYNVDTIAGRFQLSF